MWIEVDDGWIMKSQWVCSCTCFLLRNGHVGCMQSRNMRNSDERDAVWHSNLDFSQFFLQKKYVPPAFLQPPHLVQPPGGCGRGTGPACAGEEAKEFWNTQREGGGCRMFMVQVTRRWVSCLWKMSHYGWTMPGWSIDVLVHQFHGARLFFENLSFGVSFRNPKMQWNQWEPFENVKMNELTKFPTSFSSGELYSWVCGQWSLLVGSSFGEANEDDFRIRKEKTRHGGFTLAVSNLFHV